MQMLMELSILFHQIFYIILTKMLNKCPTEMLKNIPRNMYIFLGFM